MADNTSENDPGVWRLYSAGLYMRADDTEAGKLVRVADVVKWLMSESGKALPRDEAVRRVCEGLERANPEPKLFMAQHGTAAVLLDGEAALFGFHTKQTWAAMEIERETLERMHRDPWRYDFRDRDNPSIDQGPPASLSAEERAAIAERVRKGEGPTVTRVAERARVLCLPGRQAAARYIRERWGAAPRSSSPDPCDEPQDRAFGLAVRGVAAKRIWGWEPRRANTAGGDEVQPVPEWQATTPSGRALRCDGSPAGRLVLLANVAQWLIKTRELPRRQAVDEVSRCFDQAYLHALFFVQSDGGYAESFIEAMDSHWVDFNPMNREFPEAMPADEKLLAGQREFFRAMALANAVALAARENEPGVEPKFNPSAESVLDFYARTRAHQAITFAAAHELWGWGTLPATEHAVPT